MAKFGNPLERWNSRFSQDGYLFGEEPNAYLRQHAPLLIGKGKTLCVADGEGRNSVWLARAGHTVTAFDFSPLAVAKARQLARRHQVHLDLHCCDWINFDWREQVFDNVVGVFFQFADPQDRAILFSKMSSALKPGGVMLIQGYHTDQLAFNTGGPGVLENLYTEELMRTSFPELSVQDLRVYRQVIQEGTGHCGMSALVGYVGVKDLPAPDQP